MIIKNLPPNKKLEIVQSERVASADEPVCSPFFVTAQDVPTHIGICLICSILERQSRMNIITLMNNP